MLHTEDGEKSPMKGRVACGAAQLLSLQAVASVAAWMSPAREPPGGGGLHSRHGPGRLSSQTSFFCPSFHASSLVSLTRHWVTPSNSPEVGWLAAPSKLLNENHKITLA